MEQSLNTFLPDASAPTSVVAGNGMRYEGIYRQVTFADIREIYKPRASFTHKGTYGHALLVAGNENTMGAALLCSLACLHAGAGLITASIPQSGLTALNTSLPEVMYLTRASIEQTATKDKFNAIAVGPGLGQDQDSIEILKTILQLNIPLVVDADALNILSKNENLLNLLPEGSIITPHMKEFDHLFGKHETWFERLNTAQQEAQKRKIIILLKNQFTFIIDPSGNIYINTTGNPGMAQGGMGDVLTGIIVSYTAQKYTNLEAAIYGCYLHGKSGDELYKTNSNVTASQVAENLPKIVRKFIAGF
jgi:hydroxyethylthiazole kinase-like uncharacterized protein yjeF